MLFFVKVGLTFSVLNLEHAQHSQMLKSALIYYHYDNDIGLRSLLEVNSFKTTIVKIESPHVKATKTKIFH
jgi:hypothetical protein